jgi:hypothetical protein
MINIQTSYKNFKGRGIIIFNYLLLNITKDNFF